MKFKKYIKIHHKTIGAGKPVFIIAEIGINHNGSFKIAKKMIKTVAECGADAVKFQTFKTEEFISNRKQLYSYISRGKVVKETLFNMFKRLELPLAWHKALFNYAKKYGVIPLSSAADIHSIQFLNKLDICAVKLASEDLTNVPLVKEAGCTRLPVILSTGMASEKEITGTLQIIKQAGNSKVILLHCTGLYPTPPEEANILRIKALRKRFNCLIGFSDHTEGNTAALGAVTLGAVIIEKHFTLDKYMNGPDHRFSADPCEFKSLVDSIKKVERVLGNGKIQPSKKELESLKWCRRSITASKNILKGTIITNELICFKRPGTGISPQNVGSVLRKVTKRNIKAGEQILLNDLSTDKKMLIIADTKIMRI